jgi:hypothetical protein
MTNLINGSIGDYIISASVIVGMATWIWQRREADIKKFQVDLDAAKNSFQSELNEGPREVGDNSDQRGARREARYAQRPAVVGGADHGRDLRSKTEHVSLPASRDGQSMKRNHIRRILAAVVVYIALMFAGAWFLWAAP